MTDLHTVVETQGYIVDADDAGMDETDRAAVVDQVAKKPDGGDNLGAGLYKVRVARPGMGKRGGWRVLVGYVSKKLPAYLLAVFAKNDKDNLSKKDIEALEGVMKDIKKTAK